MQVVSEHALRTVLEPQPVQPQGKFPTESAPRNVFSLRLR
ncbi:MAG: hypothetical protein QOE41_3253, partial [Mycobacterium sp.]|nr:hypothetical protein [Mycobacterium sp.]